MGLNGTGRPNSDAPEDGADGAHVRGQLEPHELDDVVVDGAAPLDGADDGGEVVVGEHHVAGFLGDLGAGDAHGHADVGPPQRGRVVHAVAGHGHDVAPALQRLDDPHLVLGRHPGAHADAVDLLGQLLVVHGRELVAGDDPPLDAQLGGDRPRGDGVVTGDHLHRDARRATQADGVASLGPGRVDDADEHLQGELLDPALGVGHGSVGPEHRGRRELPGRHGKDAHALRGQSVVVGLAAGAGRGVERDLGAVAARRRWSTGRAARRGRPSRTPARRCSGPPDRTSGSWP